MPDSSQATPDVDRRVRRLLDLAAELWLEGRAGWSIEETFVDEAKAAIHREMGRF